MKRPRPVWRAARAEFAAYSLNILLIGKAHALDSQPPTVILLSCRGSCPKFAPSAGGIGQSGKNVDARSPAAFDEMNGCGKEVREPYRSVSEWLQTQEIDDLKRKRSEAEALFRRTGITFSVYGEEAATERLIPFDIIP